MARAIVKQPSLNPAAMAAVADRRFADAKALLGLKRNAHNNGVVYLGGFVVEILLKAQLARKYPSISKRHFHSIQSAGKDEQEIWSLIWRRHDLDGMLNYMPELKVALSAQARPDGVNYFGHLMYVCSVWSIYLRYSPKNLTSSEASTFLNRVQSLKEVLK